VVKHLEDGVSVRQTARLTGVPQATVSRWGKEARELCEAAREAARAEAEADARAQRAPQITIYRPDDEESYDDRAIDTACARYEGVLMVQGPRCVRDIIDNPDSSARDKIMALDAAARLYSTLDAIRQARTEAADRKEAGYVTVRFERRDTKALPDTTPVEVAEDDTPDFPAEAIA
jgi:hypothetical protein